MSIIPAPVCLASVHVELREAITDHAKLLLFDAEGRSLTRGMDGEALDLILLRSIVRYESTVALEIIKYLNVDLCKLDRKIASRLDRLSKEGLQIGHFSFTRLTRIVQSARDIMHLRAESCIDSAHLLAALMRDGANGVTDIMLELEMSSEKIFAEMDRLSR